MTDISSVDDAQAPAERDRVTIGPTSANKDILQMLVDQGHFTTSFAAFQAAAVLALRKKLDATSLAAAAPTVWNRGSFDSKLLEFLTWVVPTAMPVRTLELLGNAGTAHIADKVRTGGYTLTELFDLPHDDGPAV